MQPLQRRRGLDTEFFVQTTPGLPESSQRIGLAAGPVQGQHEQATQPFPQRVLGYQIP